MEEKGFEYTRRRRHDDKENVDSKIIFKLVSKRLLWQILRGELQGWAFLDVQDLNWRGEQALFTWNAVPRAFSRADPKFHLTGLENVLLSRLEAVDQHRTSSQLQIEALKLYFYHKISCPERKRVTAKSLRNVSQRNSCRRFIKLSRD